MAIGPPTLRGVPLKTREGFRLGWQRLAIAASLYRALYQMAGNPQKTVHLGPMPYATDVGNGGKPCIRRVGGRGASRIPAANVTYAPFRENALKANLYLQGALGGIAM